jgi:hypothetical protein
MKEYERDGYKGTMYEAPTKNMRMAENKLLGSDLLHNDQGKSNVEAKPGHTYVIKGRKEGNSIE